MLSDHYRYEIVTLSTTKVVSYISTAYEYASYMKIIPFDQRKLELQ